MKKIICKVIELCFPARVAELKRSAANHAAIRAESARLLQNELNREHWKRYGWMVNERHEYLNEPSAR